MRFRDHFAIDIFDDENSVHIWAGPVGLHVFWPDLHHTRPEWCWGYWR